MDLETLKMILCNNTQTIIVYRGMNSPIVNEVVYIEDQNTVRIWYFDGNGDAVDTQYVTANNALMELIKIYSRSVDKYGMSSVCWSKSESYKYSG